MMQSEESLRLEIKIGRCLMSRHLNRRRSAEVLRLALRFTRLAAWWLLRGCWKAVQEGTESGARGWR